MLSDKELARLNQLRPENREYEDISTAQLASYYWQLTNILQNEHVGKEYIYETVKQFQLMTKRLTKNPMLNDPNEQIRMFDEIRQIGEQTSDALDPYVIKSKMELLSERVGFKRICWSNGISIGIPKLPQHVDCGIDWQAIGKNPNNYLHVFTLYGKNVPHMILNSTLPRVTISSSYDETMEDLSLYGRHSVSKGVEKFWNTNWSLDGSITENKAVLTVPYIYDEYGMVKPEYEEFGHAIVDKMSEFFL